MSNQVIVAEVIGPAGAGKTTLCRNVIRHDPTILACTMPGVRQIRNLPFFIVFGSLALPGFLQQFASDRLLTWEESKKLIYLRGMHRRIRACRNEQATVVLLDQGPVFEMTHFRAFGPSRLRLVRAKRWWNTTFDRWSLIYDRIVWLDAQDEVLLGRIRTRETWHLAKHLSDFEARQLIEDYRSAFQEVSSELQRRGVDLVRVDTSNLDPGELVKKVLPALQ